MTEMKEEESEAPFRGEYETVVGFGDNPFLRAEKNKKKMD